MKTTKKPKFDKEGYQKGKPHLAGEEVDFAAAAKAKPLSFEEVSALGLPSPEELAKKKPGTKITLAVDDDALEFFKTEAKRLNTSYQGMMRTLLSAYVARVHSQRRAAAPKRTTQSRPT